MRSDDLRLMAKVADLYHKRGLKQTDISRQLGIHQSTISRLLKRAEQEGIVSIALNYPVGFHPELESALETRFGLAQAIIVDSGEREDDLLSRLGSATAVYVATTLRATDIVGISSWSSSLLAMVNALHAGQASGATVVQILGGVGNPSAEAHATRMTQRLAQLINANAIFLPAPGIVRSKSARAALLEERYVAQAIRLFDQITVALVGIGAIEPSPMFAESGNAFTKDELRKLRESGAVGDICMRFFDAQGREAQSPLNDQVIGISLDQLNTVGRVVAVAGGMRKKDAINAALRGGRINTLITDEAVARAIVGPAPERT